MGFFDAIGSVGKGASDKAKNISEANNLKRKILYEEERIVEIFTDIGKKYYKNPDGDTSELKTLCDDIDSSADDSFYTKDWDINGVAATLAVQKID